MQFRKAEKEDLKAMTTLIQEAVENFRADGVDQWQYGYPNAQILEDDISRQTSYVLEENGEIIGMMNLQQVPDASYAEIDGSWLSDFPYTSFHRVCVSGAHKGKGCAGILFRAAEEISRSLGFSAVRIDTHEDNLAMRRAIFKNGFRFCGTIRLADGEEAGAPRLAYEKVF